MHQKFYIYFFFAKTLFFKTAATHPQTVKKKVDAAFFSLSDDVLLQF